MKINVKKFKSHYPTEVRDNDLIHLELIKFNGEIVTDCGLAVNMRKVLKNVIDECSSGVIWVEGAVNFIFYRGFGNKIIWEKVRLPRDYEMPGHTSGNTDGKKADGSACASLFGRKMPSR